ncbi:unnamed protein product [Enterobius vermicularis]|uniref:Not1 domain-containing protein n=1 Tax=Enterobius vermicularis TaxID=51028 RepID=A0A0N4UTL5_ENTVE|nr:unnamed protein product [Enterobius vermicularis]
MSIKRSFPGVWEIPVNQFYYSHKNQTNVGRHSSMLRAVVDLNATVDELYNLLSFNFEKAYFGNRAPYLLTLTADFLQLNAQNTGMLALQRFLNRITTNKDVYIVTIKQLIEWMQDPSPLSRIYQSNALRCTRGRTPRTMGDGLCEQPNKCMYRTPDLNSPEHQFLTCNPCPELYPWVENPAGKLRL